MRIFVLCALFYIWPSVCWAQDAVVAKRLNDAVFAASDLRQTRFAEPASPGTVIIGPLVIEQTYSLKRTAESWRVPESGQDITTQELQFNAYVLDHPLVRFGARYIMRSGRHKECESRDSPACASHYGYEPNDQKFMVNLNWLFDRK